MGTTLRQIQSRCDLTERHRNSTVREQFDDVKAALCGNMSHKITGQKK
jgi:hypothetical protein